MLISGALALPGSGTVSVAGGATLSTADGTARTTTVGGLNLNNGATLAMDWGDQLATAATATPTGSIILNPSGSYLFGNVYTPLTAGGGLNNANYLLANNAAYTAAISVSSTSVTITPSTATALGTAYWYGGQVTGAPAAMALSNGTASNWSTTQASLASTGQVPGAATNVIFSATGATQESSVVLGANMTVNSLTFSDTTAVTIGNDGNALTLMSTGSGTNSAIDANQSGTINAALVLGASQTWTVAGGATLSVGGPVSGAVGNGSGGLTLAGAGTVLLSGSNTYSGNTTISGGTLQANAANTLPATTNVTLANTAGAMLNLNGFNQTIASLAGGGASGGNVTLGAGTLTVGSSATTTYSGAISGIGSLIKIGSGTQILSGSNTYSGGTVINAGTLQSSTSGALAVSTSATVNNAGSTFAVNYGGASDYSQAQVATLLGNTTFSATTTAFGLDTTHATSPVTYGNVLSMPAGLTKLGTGTLILNQSNTYPGTTAVNGGTLSLANSAALAGGGGITFGGGTLQFTGSNTQDYSPRIANSSGAVSIDTNGQNVTFASGLNSSNSGGLAKRGTGTLLLAGPSTYGGVTYVTAGLLAFGGSGNSLPGAVNVTTGGTLQFQGSSVTSFTATGDGNFNVTSASTVAIQPGAAVTLAGDMKLGAFGQGVGNVVQTGGTLTITDSFSNRPLTIGEYNGETSTYTLAGGLLNVPNSTTYAPWDGAAVFTISAGTADLKKIEIGSGDGLATGGTLTVSGSGAVYVGSGGIVNGYGPATINLAGGTLGAYATWSSSCAMGLANAPTIDTNGSGITLSGALSGTGSLTKVNGGQLTLGASNNYSGGTSINAGTLQLGNSAALGAAAANVAIAGGAMLDLNGFGPSVGGLNGAGLVDDVGGGNSPTLTVGNGNANGSFAGAIQDTSGIIALRKVGSGLQVLSGSNGYIGGTTVSGGTLQLGNNSSLGSGGLTANNGTLDLAGFSPIVPSLNGLAGTITNSGSALSTLTVNQSTATTFSGAIANGATNQVALVKMATGTLTLSGSSNYGGGTTLANGTLVVANPAGLGASSGSLGIGAATLEVASGFSSSGSISFNSASSTIQVDANQIYQQLRSNLRYGRTEPDRQRHAGVGRHGHAGKFLLREGRPLAGRWFADPSRAERHQRGPTGRDGYDDPDFGRHLLQEFGRQHFRRRVGRRRGRGSRQRQPDLERHRQHV